MTVQIPAPIPMDEEAKLLNLAQKGDQAAFTSLVDPWRAPLFGYIYRMTTQRQDAEDLLQDVLVRVLEGLPQFRRESRFKSWLFGIATHVCLDHLRQKKRWRVEAQMLGERETTESPEFSNGLRALVARPEFRFEIREHIAFCFACIARTLPPEEQAALLLREMLEFTAEESAAILDISEPVFRHRLSAARAVMTHAYDGLCQLINKTGACWQCRGLRELTPEQNRGADLVQINVAPGLAVTPENLLDTRLRIAREADLENGRSSPMHDLFYQNLSNREESRP